MDLKCSVCNEEAKSLLDTWLVYVVDWYKKNVEGYMIVWDLDCIGNCVRSTVWSAKIHDMKKWQINLLCQSMRILRFGGTGHQNFAENGKQLPICHSDCHTKLYVCSLHLITGFSPIRKKTTYFPNMAEVKND